MMKVINEDVRGNVAGDEGDRGHGDDGPVEGRGEGDELVGVGVLLHDEGEPGEDEHAHDDDQGQEAELLVAGLGGHWLHGRWLRQGSLS